MNEPERERILQMLADGTLRPAEATQLLVALADRNKPSVGTAAPAPAKAEAAVKAKPKSVLEVDMQRQDGTHKKIEVPSNLVPMVWEITKEAIKESTKTAAAETWSGFKHIVRRNVRQVKTGVTSRFTGGKPKPVAVAVVVAPDASKQFEARRQVLQMVQNGRISAEDAGRIIQQLDASE